MSRKKQSFQKYSVLRPATAPRNKVQGPVLRSLATGGSKAKAKLPLVTTQLTEKEFEWITQCSRDTRRSISYIVRVLVREGLEVLMTSPDRDKIVTTAGSLRASVSK